jgi:AraC family transcriptional activator FtrA
MPKCKRDKRLVAALIYPNLCTFEFGVTAEIFGLPRPEMGLDWYRFVTCSETARPVRAVGGVRVRAEADLAALHRAHTIVIPGWGIDRPPCSERLRRALLRAHRDGARIITICSGAFLAAELGLLDGQAATTHWRYAEKLRARFPQIEVAPDVLYIDNGNVLTSAGSAAGIDLLLHVVRSDYGAKVANIVARRLVVAPHRAGGQKQYVDGPVPTARSEKLSRLFDLVRGAPQREWSLAAMAKAAALSERTLARRVREATGLSPGEWLLQTRVARARDLLEATDAPLVAVAEKCGLGTPENLIRQFAKRVGVTPCEYRRSFGARGLQNEPA